LSEILLDEKPGDAAAAAYDAACGHVVYLTEHGHHLAAIVPADVAAEREDLTLAEFRELLEDFAEAQAAQDEPAESRQGPALSQQSRSGRR
jgi:antitoxin (DNA-binding transcriptional repressor) of toxin-antitoxin stability system